MTETADAGTSTGLTVLVWGFRFVQIVLVGLGIILGIGSLGMYGLTALSVLGFATFLFVLALVVEILAVRPCKGRA